MREFRRGWKYSPLSAAKRLEYLRAFFRFCVDAGWLERNPAAALKPSKVPHRPTLPFTDAEVERLLVAAKTLVDFGRYGPRIEPMILLLRYSGLRMQDAACLERARLDDDKLFLYQQKISTPVYCPLPSNVVAGLAALTNTNDQFFSTTARASRRAWSRAGTASSRRSERQPSQRLRTVIRIGFATPSRCRCFQKALLSTASRSCSVTARSRSQSASTRHG
jgi:integrase